MTTSDVVRLLGRSNSTVVRMVDDGKITPAYKLPGLRGGYLFDRSQIEALAEGDE